MAHAIKNGAANMLSQIDMILHMDMICRNCLLHQSTPNVEKSTIHESRCRVDKFELVITGEDGTNGDLSEVAYDKDMNIVQRGLKVHISHLCYILSTAAEDYYKNNKEKFDFIKYSIEDDRQKTIL